MRHSNSSKTLRFEKYKGRFRFLYTSINGKEFVPRTQWQLKKCSRDMAFLQMNHWRHQMTNKKTENRHDIILFNDGVLFVFGSQEPRGDHSSSTYYEYSASSQPTPQVTCSKQANYYLHLFRAHLQQFLCFDSWCCFRQFFNIIRG